jgi:hypothetical protein
MQEGFYRSQRSNSEEGLYRQAMDERTYRVLLTHGNAFERSVRSGTCPDEDSPDNSSARLRQAAQQRVEHTRTLRMLAHDRRTRSHWKNDFKHAPPHCGRRLCYPLLLKASTTPVLKSKLVTKTSAVISPSNTSHHG